MEYKSIALTADTSKTGGSWDDILTLTLTKGVWIVVGVVNFLDSSSSSVKWMRISATGSDPYYRDGSTTAGCCMSYSQIVNVTNATSNVTLRTYANAAYSLGKTNTMLRAVRIGDLKETT